LHLCISGRRLREDVGMLVVQLLILMVLLIVLPFLVGGVFSVVESGRGRRMFQWISGQFLIWVGMELIAVALIIKRDGLNKAMILFWVYIVAVVCFALGTLVCQRVRGAKKHVETGKTLKKSSALCKMLWGVFAVLLLYQLVQMARIYYTVATPEQITPFYVTSPFSMWIAFLAKSSGMQPMVVEQIVLPIVFLCMSYGVFYLLGAKLLSKKREYPPLFLVILSVLATAGEFVYKRYGADFWPLEESKTEIMMLGGVLLPYLVFLLVLFGKVLRKKKRA